MATNTARLGLQVPTSTDNISSFPTVDAQALDILDAAVIITQGTLASRPAANTVPEGNEYYATDTSQLFKSTGSAWNQVPVINSSGSSTVLQLASAAQLAVAAGTSGNVAAGSSVTINHGLGRTPVNVQLTTTWADNTAAGYWVVYNASSSQFTAANKGSTTANFYWLAIG